jgi:hypothetical protein
VQADCVIANQILGKWQPAITRKIYSILFNYLSEISAENMLQTRSFVLCMHILDRVLQDRYRNLKRESERTPIKLDKFQLLGCACLLIASKIEEIYVSFFSSVLFVMADCFVSPQAPSADALVKTSGNSFDKTQLFAMECSVLRDLKFKVVTPTRLDFGLRFGVAAGMSKRELSLLTFLLEMSFLEFDLNKSTHSMVAAAAVHLTLQMMRDPEDPLWGATLQHYSGYEESDFAGLVVVLAELRFNIDASRAKGLLQKYGTEEHCCVAEMMALPAAYVRFDHKTSLLAYRVRTNKGGASAFNQQLLAMS